MTRSLTCTPGLSSRRCVDQVALRRPRSAGRSRRLIGPSTRAVVGVLGALDNTLGDAEHFAAQPSEDACRR